MARDVFISYSQPDRDCAFELTEHLEAEGFTVWIAPRDVSPAAEWAEEIIEAISAARIMVLVFSASSNESAQVRREVERAVHKDLRVLPFRIENVLPSRSLEYFLSSQHWLDGFPAPRAPHYERLCGHLRQWLREPPARRQTGESAPLPTASRAPMVAGPDSAAIGPAPDRFSAGELRGLETRLARILGPIAGVLVTRAAAAAADGPDLERRLAAELDSPDDRRRFLQSRQ
ncbi:MAG TPA: toll/interleukin-1 receptor domain-containing protein [Steroidobacteraceae bacterium]|nr:toll/interleukin-1 receptor domain-containing protein [Steroidobacteraceae bacterium]